MGILTVLLHVSSVYNVKTDTDFIQFLVRDASHARDMPTRWQMDFLCQIQLLGGAITVNTFWWELQLQNEFVV